MLIIKDYVLVNEKFPMKEHQGKLGIVTSTFYYNPFIRQVIDVVTVETSDGYQLQGTEEKFTRLIEIK